jgi:hypothetical protein
MEVQEGMLRQSYKTRLASPICIRLNLGEYWCPTNASRILQLHFPSPQSRFHHELVKHLLRLQTLHYGHMSWKTHSTSRRMNLRYPLYSDCGSGITRGSLDTSQPSLLFQVSFRWHRRIPRHDGTHTNTPSMFQVIPEDPSTQHNLHWYAKCVPNDIGGSLDTPSPTLTSQVCSRWHRRIPRHTITHTNSWMRQGGWRAAKGIKFISHTWGIKTKG